MKKIPILTLGFLCLYMTGYAQNRIPHPLTGVNLVNKIDTIKLKDCICSENDFLDYYDNLLETYMEFSVNEEYYIERLEQEAEKILNEDAKAHHFIVKEGY